MKLETYILEDSDVMDFGDAQDAYDNYFETMGKFLASKVLYKGFLNELSLRNPESISNDDIQKINFLYQNARQLKGEYERMVAILVTRTDAFIRDGKYIECSLSVYKNHIDMMEMKYGQSLLRDAIKLRENGETPGKVLAKAKKAKICLQALLYMANRAWLNSHQINMDSLTLEEDIQTDKSEFLLL